MQSINSRILYIDDDKDSCEMMTLLLGTQGYDVVHAHTSAEAMQKAKSDGFELCLLDNWLPDGSGIELCSQLRSLKPQTPIVFYSAAARESDKEAALRAGAQAYLVKPTGIETLGQTISSLLGRDGVKRAAPLAPALSSQVSVDALKQVGRDCVESSRRRLDRSRHLANETMERIERSDLKIALTLSKQDRGKR